MKRVIAMLLCSALVVALAVFAAPKSIGGNKPDNCENPADYSEVFEAIKKLQREYKKMRVAGMNDDIAVYEAEAPAAADGAAAEESDTLKDYYGTNVQVEGIDEADIVKTDGKYIYAIKDNAVSVYKAAGEDTCLVKTLSVCDDDSCYANEMFVSGDRLIVICNPGYMCYACYDVAYNGSEKTEIYVYDISSPENAALSHKLAQDGSYNTARLYDGKLYVITNYFVYDEAKENNPSSYIPRTYCDGVESLVPSDCIKIMPSPDSASYAVCTCYDATDCSLTDSESILGGCDNVYMSENAIYLVRSRFDETVSDEYEKDGYTVTDHSTKRYTDIYRLGFEDGLDLTADGRVDGYIDSQFSLDEYDGKLRVVTTNNYESYSIYTDKKHNFENYEWHDNGVASDNALYILDSDLNEISSVTHIAENEYVYSVRFDGDYVYFCTFRQTDPLFAVDVSNSKNPKILSKFKISGFSDYLHVWNDDLLFGLGMEANDEGRTSTIKMIMFDISDKSDVRAANSTVLDESYSDALYNHKALLIVPEKNLIAFQCNDNYCIFTYTDDGFALKQRVGLPDEWGMFRGMVIGDNIYIVHSSGLSVLSIDDFSIVKDI